jgi:hypothetical protein
MRRAVLVLALVLPTAALAEPTAAGRIETDEGTVEILGRPVRVGERVETPEGWIRVDEAGPEDGEVGSFSVVAAGSFGAAHQDADGDDAAPVAAAEDPAPRGPARPPACRAERAAYLAELWRASGIEVSAPDAVIDGLEAGGAGPGTGYAWFALATDAFRPLAWSSSLRARAEALARCVRGD